MSAYAANAPASLYGFSTACRRRRVMTYISRQVFSTQPATDGQPGRHYPIPYFLRPFLAYSSAGRAAVIPRRCRAERLSYTEDERKLAGSGRHYVEDASKRFYTRHFSYASLSRLTFLLGYRRRSSASHEAEIFVMRDYNDDTTNFARKLVPAYRRRDFSSELFSVPAPPCLNTCRLGGRKIGLVKIEGRRDMRADDAAKCRGHDAFRAQDSETLRLP